MPKIEVLTGNYACIAYRGNEASTANSYVVVNGQTVTASARITGCDFVRTADYLDTVIDILFEFSSNGGTLQRLHTTCVFPAAGQKWGIELCSDESIGIPAGTVRIGKRYIIRAYFS